MAAARHSVSDLPPLVGAVSLESPHSGQLLIDTSKSCTQATSPSRLAGVQGHTCQEEPKQVISDIFKERSEPPSKGATNHSSVGELGEQKQTSSCPHSLTEAHTPTYHQERVVNAISANPQTDRIVHSMTPASLPVHRSHSGTLPLVKKGVAPTDPDTETCGLAYHGGDKNIQEAESHSMLACKQPMQLQQCNIITTICRGASCGDAGVKQPPTRCACISSPPTAAEVEEKEEHPPPNCDKALCYGSYIHQTNFEDTFAAYCHPQPIPAPSQVLPRLVESSCDIQRPVAPPLALNHLTLPRLISSVSETGLDAKHLLRCCNLNCPWMATLPPSAGPPSQKHFGLEVCCNSPGGHFRTVTRDMGTMTAKKELRDVGVQTGQAATPHVFPQICLAEDSKRETSHSKTPNTGRDGGKKLSGAHKSPVKEVKWDAEGMTWEVYGASVDPEELGLAIQKHLELQIKETANHAAKLAQQKANTSQQSRIIGRQRKRSRMMSSIRTPACCARTTSAVD